VQRARATGTVTAFDKRGGWQSPVDLPVLHRLVQEKPDRPTDELTRAYNRAVVAEARVHRSSVLRALQRTGYVFKKNERDRRNRIVPASKPNARPSDNGSKG
jgi:transposase